MKIKRILLVALCFSLILPTAIWAVESPKGEVIPKETQKEPERKKRKKNNNNTNNNNNNNNNNNSNTNTNISTNTNGTSNKTINNSGNTSNKENAPVKMIYQGAEGLISPETGGIFKSETDGFVDDIGTEIPKDVFDDTKEDNKKIDWKKVEEYNPEIYAWIVVPNTNINYPILQKNLLNNSLEDYSNQLYYKWHDFYDKEKKAGSVFTQYPTPLDFSDQINFLYGNNVIDGTMFENLHKFMQDVEVKDLHLSKETEEDLLKKEIDEEGLRKFDKDDLEFKIYLKDKVLTYRIYASYYWTDEHLQFYVENGEIKLKLQTPEEIKKYIDTSKEPKTLNSIIYHTDVYVDKNTNKISNTEIETTFTEKKDVIDALDENSRILTLSTSITDNATNRLLVQAVLVDEKELVNEEENLQNNIQGRDSN